MHKALAYLACLLIVLLIIGGLMTIVMAINDGKLIALALGVLLAWAGFAILDKLGSTNKKGKS